MTLHSRASRAFLLITALVIAVCMTMGCELLVNFDRSLIDAGVEVDASPDVATADGQSPEDTGVVDSTLPPTDAGDSGVADSGSADTGVADTGVDAADAGCSSAAQCPTDQACDVATHQCTTTCSASQPCNGVCCNGTTCESTASATACGAAGATCTNCVTGDGGAACVSGSVRVQQRERLPRGRVVQPGDPPVHDVVLGEPAVQRRVLRLVEHLHDGPRARRVRRQRRDVRRVQRHAAVERRRSVHRRIDRRIVRVQLGDRLRLRDCVRHDDPRVRHDVLGDGPLQRRLLQRHHVCGGDDERRVRNERDLRGLLRQHPGVPVERDLRVQHVVRLPHRASVQHDVARLLDQLRGRAHLQRRVLRLDEHLQRRHRADDVRLDRRGVRDVRGERWRDRV